jgi:hypothetical protein
MEERTKSLDDLHDVFVEQLNAIVNGFHFTEDIAS